ncbi:MAG: hypothetical protein ACFFD4_12415 [Candidatus Odinarchaeota archaeon]
MVDTFSILAGAVLLVLIAVNSSFPFRLLLDYPDMSSVRLFIMALLVSLWAVFTVLFLFEPVLPGDTGKILSFLYPASLICLFSGLILLSFMLNQSLHGRVMRFFINASTVVHTATAALAAVDLFSEYPVFFILSPVDGEWILFLHPFSTVMTMLAALCVMTSVSGSILVSNPVREHFFIPRKRFKAVFLTVFTVFLVMMPAGFIGTVIVHAVPLKVAFTVNVVVILGLFITTFYLTVTQPLFLLLSGARPDPFLTRGYMGYFLGAFKDDGPEPVLVSAAFKERMHLSDLTLLHLNLKILAVSGTDCSARSQREAAVIHVPVTDNINALGVYFTSTNPMANDPRLQRFTPVVFGILFPTVLNETFQHVFTILPLVTGQVSGKTLAGLEDQAFLEELARTVLRKLLG